MFFAILQNIDLILYFTGQLNVYSKNRQKNLLHKHTTMDNQIAPLCNTLLKYLPRNHFNKISGQLKTDKRSKGFSTWQAFLWLFIGQVLNVDSIRELCCILETRSTTLYHIWIKKFSRSNFSERINKLNPYVFQQVFYKLLEQVQYEVNSINKNNMLQKIYAIDSTLISLTLSVFNWATYRKKKWWIKVHTRLDITDALPDLMVITEWNVHDSKAIYDLLSWIKSWDVLLFDRWYLDYKLLYHLEEKWITYVTRTKKSTNFCPIEYNEITHPKVQYDAICEFVNVDSYEKYPKKFRIVRYYVEEKEKEYEYITNNFDYPAEMIAELYKQRWQIEELFRRLKQNLKIKQFFWTSRNAVENQIRVAMTYYLLLQYIKIKTRAKESLLELTRRFSVLLFDRINLLNVINITTKKLKNLPKIVAPPQISLFSDF